MENLLQGKTCVVDERLLDKLTLEIRPTKLGIAKINSHFEDAMLYYALPQHSTKILNLKPTITYNEKQKVVVIYNIGKEVIKIECAKNDKFDLRIGVGLAISKWLDCKKYKVLRTKFFRKNNKLDYKKYAEFILLDYFCYNVEEIDKFISELKNEGRKFL